MISLRFDDRAVMGDAAQRRRRLPVAMDLNAARPARRPHDAAPRRR